MSRFAWIALVAVIALTVVCLLAVYFLVVRRRRMHIWLPTYLRNARANRRIKNRHFKHQASRRHEPIDVFIAVCDHYEPEAAHADPATALKRVERWRDEYPRLVDPFRDSSGRIPQHTFFFPQDQYRPEYLDVLAELCEAGYGDVDVHLHHDNDTEHGLREKLAGFRDTLFHCHSLLRRDPDSGEIVYGFIHGNWALCNSRPDRRWCGVNREIPILLETGCYADFTMPAAPSDAQTTTINSIYYAFDNGDRPKAHDKGLRACVGQLAPKDSLLMIQGPLGLDWTHRKFGLIPRTENGDLHGTRPPSMSRFHQWMNAHVHVQGRPSWAFIKLHTHGCKPRNINTLLGPDVVRFHADLADYAAGHDGFRYHYVTAWEMSRIVHAAERRETDWKSAIETSSVRDAVLSPISQ